MDNQKYKSADAKKRADGFANVLSRVGTSRSKTGANVYTASAHLSGRVVRDIYNSGGVGAKVITRVADDMTRKGFTLVSEADEAKSKEAKDLFESLKGTIRFNTAIRWARAYGGSLVVMGIKDGKSKTSKVSTKKSLVVESLDVYEAGNSNVVTVQSYYKNKYSAKFGEPEIYSINAPDRTFDVHESRCIVFDGRVVDTTTKMELNGWMGSELQPVYDALLSMFSQMVSGEQVLAEMIIGTLKMENLDSMLMDSEGEELVRKRLELVDTSKGNEGSIAIGINEEYARHTVNLSGVSNLQQNAMTLVAGSADIPATFLYGSSPDGQNATGTSDENQYFGKIDAERDYFYKPALLQFFNLILGVTDLDIEFPSLRIENFYDSSRALNHITKSIKDLVDALIVSPEEGNAMLKEAGFDKKLREVLN